MRSFIWRGLACVCACLVLCLPAGCGRHAPDLSTPDLAALPASPAPDLSLDLPLPAGADPQLWARLSTALREAVAQRAKAGAAALPAAEASRVSDFAIVPDAAGVAEASWTYANPGDYNQNGTVGADDLAVIAAYFGLDLSSPQWNQASVADGNASNSIDAHDVTTIAQNFGSAIGGYSVQFNSVADEQAAWVNMLSVPLSQGALRPYDRRREFRLALSGAQAGYYYRVVPYLAVTGAPTGFGLSSNACRFDGGTAGPGAWPMAGGNPRHSSYSPVPGPAQLGLRWVLDADASTYGGWQQTPILGRDGVVYLAQQQALCAYNSDGTLRWRWEYPLYECHNPAVGSDGTLYILSEPLNSVNDPCTLFALGSDGRLRWQQTVPGTLGHLVVDGSSIYVSTTAGNTCYTADGARRWTCATGSADPGPIAVDQLGSAYFVNGLELVKRLPGGAQAWSISLPGATTAALTIRPDGVVLAPTSRGLCAYNSAGQELWRALTAGGRVKTLAVVPDNMTVLIADRAPEPEGRMVLAVLNASGAVSRQVELAYQSTNPFITLDAAHNIYLVTNSNVRCLALDGTLRWAFGFPSAYWTSAAEQGCAIGSDGALYLAWDKYAYCLRADGTPPLAAPAVSATLAQFIDHIRVSWAAVPGAQYYRVYRDAVAAPLVELSGTQYDDYSVLDLAPHTYRVCAFNELGQGATGVSPAALLKPSGLNNGGPGDWAQYGHDARRTFCAGASGPAQGAIMWTHTPGDFESYDYNLSYAPVIGADGTVYVSYNDGRIEALAPDGALKWRLDLPARVGQLALGPNGTLYFGAARPQRYRQGPPPPPPPPLSPFYEELYAIETPTVYAIAPDRTLRWEYAITDDPYGRLPEVTPGDGGLIYASASYTALVALSAAGQLLARHELPDTLSFDDHVSIAPDGRLYLRDRTADAYARLLLLDPLLTELWRFTWSNELYTDYPTHAPAIADDGTLFMSGTLTVSGSPAAGFSMRSPGAVSIRPALAANGRVYVANLADHPASAPGGMSYFKDRALVELPGWIWPLTSNILLDAEGKAYYTSFISSSQQTVFCIGANDSKLWELTLPENQDDLELVLGNDGTLYAMQGNIVYAIGTP